VEFLDLISETVAASMTLTCEVYGSGP